jgi:hypothetical protein
MKRSVKWLFRGAAVLALAGLAAFLFVEVIAVPSESLAPQSFAGRLRVLTGFFQQPVREAGFVRTVQIVFPNRMAGREMEPQEVAVQQQLEALLISREPTHRLVYDGFKTMTGRLAEDHPDYIVFSKKYGESGEMSVQLARSRIVQLEPCPAAQPEISPRDVRFHMEFPGKYFYKSAPYTIITEESFFAVEHMVKQQQDLYMQVTEWFKPLTGGDGLQGDVQLLIFSDAKEFAAYRDRYAQELQGSSGFYSHGMYRMVVHHQRDSDWVKDGKQQIAAVEKEHLDRLRTEQARQNLSQWKDSAQGQLLAQADKATESVIRHEGAHHLFFTLGIQNRLQSRRGWITEGLATFCETPKIGQSNASRLDDLKPALANGTLIPLRELTAMPRCEGSLAYAEAWALTHMLMQPPYRSGFFSYLDWLRRNPLTPVRDSVEELSRFLPLRPDEIEAHWRAHITRLAGR